MRIRHLDLLPADVTTVSTRRCTTELATALAIAADEVPLRSVPALDVLLRRGLNRRRLQAAAEALTGRGARRARQAVGLADPRAESQPESALRVVLALAGIATVPQHTVRDADGRFVARVDLALPDLRIAIEYDGAWHGDPSQLARDRQRLNRLTAAGWTVLFVTAAEMRDHAALVRRVRDLVRARPGKSSF